MPIYSINGIVPVVDPSAYVHPTASLIGDVIIGPGCYIGPCASLRGDMGRISVGEGANIQDSCVLHCRPGAELIIETDGHIGHGAVLHGCKIEQNVLVGINAIILDDAVIGESSVVAAATFVKSGFSCPPRSLIMGIPGQVVRELTEEAISNKRKETEVYQRLAVRCRESLVETEPLVEVEPQRKRFTSTDC